MTAEVLSFEPVYKDGCTLAPTPSTARDEITIVSFEA